MTASCIFEVIGAGAGGRHHLQGVLFHLGCCCDDIPELINLRLGSQDEHTVQACICVLLVFRLSQALLQIRVQFLLSGSRRQYDLQEQLHIQFKFAEFESCMLSDDKLQLENRLQRVI